ncbi:MAG: hypothetical protein V2J65_21715 [Desulfobacteraceae bacterium]|nr:hypothetical protein [Desulfobacteraceae bacterium]
MMRSPIRSIAIGIIIIIQSSIGAIHAADLKDGFMGIRWKSDLSASPDFVKISEQDEISNYIKPSVIHTVGDIKIYPVVYSSFANEFFAVYFQNDIIVFGQLRNYFNKKYGASTATTRLNPRRTTNIWNHHDVEITLKLNRETGKLKLSFYYTPLSAKVDKIRLEAYQENTRSFLDRINTDRAEEFMDMMR